MKTFETGLRYQIFSYFVEIYIFFPFSTAIRKQQKILACFPEDKLSTIYLDLQIHEVFTPRLLMHRVCFLDVINHLTAVSVKTLSQDVFDTFWTTKDLFLRSIQVGLKYSTF